MEFKEEPFIMSFSNPESIDAVISIFNVQNILILLPKSNNKKQNK